MAHHVYANDNEICSKSADGKSVMATDACFSPGAPYPGVPVTYMNTCQASDITNGSKTVFIMGGEICLEDRSYFAQSYGDEPATQALKKGVISNAVQGKCYFIAWSPNVFVESLAVTRHMDMVTHNHSNPANTPPVYYVSRAAPPKDCVKDIKKMDERCKPDDDKTKIRKGKKLVKKDADKLDGWVLDHCGPLLVPPKLDNFKEWMAEFGDLNKLVSEAAETLKTEVIQKLEQEIAEYAAKKLAKMAIRRGLTGWIPIVGWALTVADVAYTGYELYQKIPELKEQLGSLKEVAQNLQNAANKISETFQKYADKIKNFDKLSAEEQGEIARELMADVQSAYALANPCLRARKCLLVPYNKTQLNDNLVGNGCCPGQTGHHLLPDAMFRDPEKAAAARKANPDINRNHLPVEKCWEGYTEGGAPTICMEGTNNSMGSHGALHKATEVALTSYKGARQMDYDTAAKLMAAQVALTYGCDADCIKAQLDDYYKNAYKCGLLSDAKLVPHTGMPYGGPKIGGGGM